MKNYYYDTPTRFKILQSMSLVVFRLELVFLVEKFITDGRKNKILNKTDISFATLRI